MTNTTYFKLMSLVAFVLGSLSIFFELMLPSWGKIMLRANGVSSPVVRGDGGGVLLGLFLLVVAAVLGFFGTRRGRQNASDTSV